MIAGSTTPRGVGRHRETDELFVHFRQTGDRWARDELVTRFLPMARAIARRYITAREPFEDLMQVANLGLLKAVERFDPERGPPFRSFAVPTILGELKRYFRDCGWSVHVTRRAQDLALRVEQAQRALDGKTGRATSVSALAEYLELPVEQVVEALETATAHHAASLDALTSTDEEGSPAPASLVGQVDDGYWLIDARMTISSLAAKLEPRDRQVLALRFGEQLTQAQIAAKIGVSQMQVSRILRRVLDQLRELSEPPSEHP